MKQSELVMQQLQQRGYRLTEQRKILIEVILEGGCSTCKEIYYQASRQDPAIGIATVYRTIAMLEDLNIISRRGIELAQER